MVEFNNESLTYIAPLKPLTMREIKELGLIVFDKESWRIFLLAPWKSFGGKTARDLIKERRLSEIYGQLAGLYEGIGF